MEREYIVTLHKGVNWEEFNEEMIALTGDGAIPQRSVGIINLRPTNTRNTHYSLTQEEVETLRNDERVLAVEIPVDQNPDVTIGFNATATAAQYGHQRHSSEIYSTFSNYDYTLDGTGVDIIIQDSGIDTTHSEFSGRVVSGGWATGNHTTDSDGHGTHVAGIACGATYGWAKGASIIPQKLNIGSITDGIAIADGLDAITAWHQNKGNSRPTIVNMSWGASIAFTEADVNAAVTGSGVTITHRGVSNFVNTVVDLNSYGIIAYGGYYQFPYRDAALDADLQQMIDAGIHVVVAAGNQYMKMDLSTGNDYNNDILFPSGLQIWYHQGSSPYVDDAITVGSIVFNSTNDRSGFSNHGPAVDIMACGSGILSSKNGGGTTTMNGTSMAAPQVCGLGALYLQAHPEYTPQQLIHKLVNSSQQGQIPSSADNDYSNTTSILNGNNRILYNRYNSQYPLTVVHIP